MANLPVSLRCCLCGSAQTAQALNTYVPMQVNIKKILNAVVVIVVVLIILNAFGILGSASRFRIG